MRIFARKAIRYTAAGTVYVAYDSLPVCRVYDTDGAVVEGPLTASLYAADTDYYYVDTTDALYTHEAIYNPRWTTVLGGVTRTVSGDPYEHYAPETGDTTGPGSASITVSDQDAESITVSHSGPGDSDYSYTEVRAVPVPGDGSDPVTATGSGDSIKVPGLSGGTVYILTATAYDEAGNASVIGSGSVCIATTLTETAPDLPLICKVFKNDEPDPRKIYYLDPTKVDSQSARATNHERHANMRGRLHRVRLECHCPAAIVQVRGVTFIVHERDGEPGGIKNMFGN